MRLLWLRTPGELEKLRRRGLDDLTCLSLVTAPGFESLFLLLPCQTRTPQIGDSCQIHAPAEGPRPSSTLRRSPEARRGARKLLWDFLAPLPHLASSTARLCDCPTTCRRGDGRPKLERAFLPLPHCWRAFPLLLLRYYRRRFGGVDSLSSQVPSRCFPSRCPSAYPGCYLSLAGLTIAGQQRWCRSAFLAQQPLGSSRNSRRT